MHKKPYVLKDDVIRLLRLFHQIVAHFCCLVRVVMKVLGPCAHGLGAANDLGGNVLVSGGESEMGVGGNSMMLFIYYMSLACNNRC